MIKNDRIIKTLMYGDTIQKLANERNITLGESKAAIKQMSFMQYLQLLEANANIIPPSGQTISPSGPTSNTTTPSSAQNKPQVMWARGVPAAQGMTVGLKGTNGLPVPGEITQVDNSARGVKVRNPTTGQEEWHGTDDLQPFMAGKSSTSSTNTITPPSAQSQQQIAEEKALERMRELAGIRPTPSGISEDASCGATGAGAIAIAPTGVGQIKRRQSIDETPPKEYTPKGPPKTIIGDTKPYQATGELSANLAVRGKKTATRVNNGIKR